MKLQGVYVFQSVSVCAAPELSKPAQNQEYPTDMTTHFMTRCKMLIEIMLALAIGTMSTYGTAVLTAGRAKNDTPMRAKVPARRRPAHVLGVLSP